MNSKKSECYESIFQHIEMSAMKLKPKTFHSDYESGLRKAIRNVYSGVKIIGCWFHYCQAVRRKCRQTKGFFRSLLCHKNGYAIYKMLLALPLLPQDKIPEGFVFIRKTVKNSKLSALLEPIFTYFDNWWLHSVKYVQHFK